MKYLAVPLLLLCAFLCHSSDSTSLEECGMTPEIRAAMTDMKIMSALLSTVRENVGLFESRVPDRPYLAGLFEEHTPGHRQCQHFDDPWASPYFVALCSDDYVVASGGPDGTLQLVDDLKRFVCDSTGVYPALKSSESDDLVIFSGTFVRHPLANVAQLQKQTTSHMRVIATGYEAGLADGDMFPRLPDGWYQAERLKQILEPGYIVAGKMPVKDAWGNPILVWIEGNELMVVSLGCDGIPEIPFSKVANPIDDLGTTSLFVLPTRDIVWANGQFRRYPLGQAPN